MRIISGEFKGRSINFIKNLNTRPLKDSVKENIFNIIEHSNHIKPVIKNSNILICILELDHLELNVFQEVQNL